MDVFSELSPDDAPIRRGLAFSGRQLAIMRLIELGEPKLGLIYRGSLEAFAAQNTDHLAMAAHGFRELMEKMFFWANEKPPGMKSKLQDDLKKPWEAVMVAMEAGSLFEDHTLIQKFFDKFRGFYEWVEASLPSRRKQAALALERLQKKREAPATFLNDQKEWLAISEYFTQVCHHRFEPTRGEFQTRIDQLEFLLLKYLRPLAAAKLNAIDQLVAATADRPTESDLNAIEHLIDGWADRDAFLRAITEPAWLTLLLSAEWFDQKSIRGSIADDPFPCFRETELLLRFVTISPSEVCIAALQLTGADNERIRGRLLEIASHLPSDLRKKFVVHATNWSKTSHTHFIHRQLEGFIKSSLPDGWSEEFTELIATVLKFHPDEQAAQKKEQRESGDLMVFMASLESRPRWEVHQYKSLIGIIVGAVLPNDRLRILPILCDCLSDGIGSSMWPDEKEARDGNDGSIYWRPAIETHEQNHNYGHREQLVTGIRDLAEKIITSDPSQFQKVDDLLVGHVWLIFKRLRIHLFRIFPQASGPAVRAAIMDTSLRASDAWHEWALLLRDQFKNLDSIAQQFILEWIENGFDATWRIDWFKQNHDGQMPDDSLVQGWKRYWQHQNLSLIADFLSDNLMRKWHELEREFGLAEHPEFHHWSSGGVQGYDHESPITLDEILSQDADQLAEQLRGWKQDQPYSEPSEWGLVAALTAAAKREPSQFIQKIHQFRHIPCGRYLAILKGCLEGASLKTNFDWAMLLRETELSIREVILPEAHRQRGDETRDNVGVDIMRSLESLIDPESSMLPFSEREAVWACICAFLEHPEPTAEQGGENSPRDFSSTFLNTPRLMAFRSIFSYAGWVRKNLSADPHENPANEILPVLDERLRNEPTLAGLAVIAERLNWLMHFHLDWLRDRLPLLFPKDTGQLEKRKAIWDSFVTMSGVMAADLTMLREDYEWAIDKCGEPLPETEAVKEGWDSGKSLVQHLCSFYWWGLLPLRTQDSLLSRFYRRAPRALRTYFLVHIGNSLRSTEGTISEEIEIRFRELMDWRLEELERSETEPEQRGELRGFFRWATANRLPAQWTLETLLRVIELAPRPEEDYEIPVFDTLAELAVELPSLAIECLHKMAFADNRLEDWWDDEPIKTVLRLGFASGSSETKKMAAEVQDVLLASGKHQFRNLEPDQ